MTTNATHPHFVGWVSEPNGRGTASLLESCFLTIFICTFTACHLDIPADEESQWHILLHKIKWMVIAVLVPEGLVWLAISDFLMARLTSDRINKVIQVSSTREHRDCQWTLAHGFFTNMGGFTLQLRDGDRWRLMAEQFCHLIERHPDLLPHITREEIEDKSKADWVVKSLSCLQISWLVVQLIGRATQDLETTPLEFFTLAIVICALVSFMFWWHKPKDVEQPYVIHFDAATITEPGLMSDLTNNYDALWLRHTLMDNIGLGGVMRNGWSKRIILTQGFAAVAFCGCHLLAWDYSFVTMAERWLWRISSLVCIIIQVVFQIVVLIDTNSHVGLSQVAAAVFYMLVVFLTVACRSFLFVEMIIALRRVPPSVYQDVNWQLYIPHL